MEIIASAIFGRSSFTFRLSRMISFTYQYAHCPSNRIYKRALVQQVPEPTVHAVLRLGMHLANLKHVRSIVFEESRSPDELKRGRFPLAHKGGISENQFHCRLQAWRIAKLRVNLFVLPFVERTGISNWHKIPYQNLNAIHELLQYSSRIVIVGFGYEKSARKSEPGILECACHNPRIGSEHVTASSCNTSIVLRA